ncbi:MAG: hypothetical protein KF833_10450 [Verrucomicrobiae bacterium]|nr:hypothetical protein [Verrucomicrobiae bacterium]
MKCSICCTTEGTRRLALRTVRTAVRNGFNPFRERGLVSDYMLGLMPPGFPGRWAESVLRKGEGEGEGGSGGEDEVEWEVCGRCEERLGHYLTPVGDAVSERAPRAVGVRRPAG